MTATASPSGAFFTTLPDQQMKATSKEQHQEGKAPMPPDEAAFAVLAHKVDTMHNDFSEIKTVLRDLTSAINKLALVEERQNQANAAQERAFKVLERLEAKVDGLDDRLTTLEIAEPEQKRVSGWVTSAVWGAAVLAATLLLSRMGVHL